MADQIPRPARSWRTEEVTPDPSPPEGIEPEDEMPRPRLSIKGPGRMTREQRQVKWEENAGARAEAFQRFRRSRVAFSGLVVLGLAGIAIPMGLMSANNNSFATQTASNRASASALQASASALADPGNAVSNQQASVILNNAQQAGAAIAAAQNAYIASSNNAASVAQGIDKYLADSSKNARVPWYQAPSQDSNGSPDYVWHFPSIYDFSAKTINVMWVCTSKSTGITLAFATAIYDTKARTFSHFIWGDTADGAARVGATEEGDKGYKSGPVLSDASAAPAAGKTSTTAPVGTKPGDDSAGPSVGVTTTAKGHH